MATYSIKSSCLVLTLALVALPAQALAGNTASSANAPVEMWDVMSPRAEIKTVVSHMDVQPGQGFDAPGMVIPMDSLFVTRADFEGSAQGTEMWDTVPAQAQAQAVGVSHMDIQPGQSFDHPSSWAPNIAASDRATATQTLSSPNT
jgi:hypothetical protein